MPALGGVQPGLDGQLLGEPEQRAQHDDGRRHEDDEQPDHDPTEAAHRRESPMTSLGAHPQGGHEDEEHGQAGHERELREHAGAGHGIQGPEEDDGHGIGGGEREHPYP